MSVAEWRPHSTSRPPACLAWTPDTNNCRVRVVYQSISTLVGVGLCDFAGDGRPLAETHIDSPVGLAVSPYGDIFISEGGGRVRLITQGSTVTTSAVFASSAQPALLSPSGLALSTAYADTLVIADVSANRLFASTFAVAAAEPVIYGGLETLAGTGLAGDAVDGPGNETALREPVGLETAYFTYQSVSQDYLVLSDSGEERAGAHVGGASIGITLPFGVSSNNCTGNHRVFVALVASNSDTTLATIAGNGTAGCVRGLAAKMLTFFAAYI